MPKKHQDAALMVDRQKVFSLALFPAGIIIKFSPSRISDMLRIGFEPLESLIPGFVELSFAVITTTPQHHKYS